MPAVHITRSTARRLALLLATVGALLVLPAAAEAKGCGYVGYHHVTATFHTSCGMARNVGWYIRTHRYLSYVRWFKSPATGGWYRLHLSHNGYDSIVYRGRGLHHSLIKVRFQA